LMRQPPAPRRQASFRAPVALPGQGRP
jgi:hypothetical protein